MYIALHVDKGEESSIFSFRSPLKENGEQEQDLSSDFLFKKREFEKYLIIFLLYNWNDVRLVIDYS